MDNEYTKRKNNRKKKNKLFVICMFIIASLFLLIIFVQIMKENENIQENSLIGLWTTDGVTVYEFKDNGNGALKLPLSEYAFTYKIEKDKLHVHFGSEKTTDSDYEYSFEDDKLILKGINDTTGYYIFYKQKSY